MPSNTILDEAKGAIYGPREKVYGPPEANFAAIAELWMVWLKFRHNTIVALLPDDVAVMMSLLKHARLMTSIDHRDSQMDICGWIANLERFQPGQQQDPPPLPTKIAGVRHGVVEVTAATLPQNTGRQE